MTKQALIEPFRPKRHSVLRTSRLIEPFRLKRNSELRSSRLIGPSAQTPARTFGSNSLTDPFVLKRNSELRSSCLDDIYHFERLKIYLPDDVDPTALTQQQKEHFEDLYNNCRERAKKVFKALVKDRFKGNLRDLLKQTIEDCLPQKPEQMHWENIRKHQQNRLTEIYFACWDRGFTKSTIKKYFRKYLLTGVDNFDILNEPYVPEHTTVLHPTEEHQMMKEWIEGKLAEKGFISRSEDFDEFHELFGYAKRTFSKKLGLFGLKFNGKKWVMEMRTRE